MGRLCFVLVPETKASLSGRQRERRRKEGGKKRKTERERERGESENEREEVGNEYWQSVLTLNHCGRPVTK
jgi:hypothetical protein